MWQAPCQELEFNGMDAHSQWGKQRHTQSVITCPEWVSGCRLGVLSKFLSLAQCTHPCHVGRLLTAHGCPPPPESSPQPFGATSLGCYSHPQAAPSLRLTDKEKRKARSPWHQSEERTIPQCHSYSKGPDPSTHLPNHWESGQGWVLTRTQPPSSSLRPSRVSLKSISARSHVPQVPMRGSAPKELKL